MPCFACGAERGADRVRISAGLSIAFCRACCTGRSESPPSAAELHDLYGDRYYEAWGLHEPGNRTEALKRTTFARRLDECAPWVRRAGKVLDLGCATGFFLREAQARGHEPFGVDVSEHAIRACAEHIASEHLHCGEFDASAFGANPDLRFDAVFMSDYLEHVLDPQAVLTLAAKRLAPGGVVVVTTPDVGSFSRHAMGRRWPHFKPEHVSYFSRRGLRRLLGAVGLEVVALRATRKALSLSYVIAQFKRYPNPWITPWLAPLRKIVPTSLADALLWVSTGELTAIARKAP